MPSDCLSCSARSNYLRMPYDPMDGRDIDTTNGLADLGGGERYACTQCGAVFVRLYEESTMFHDYDAYAFQRLPDPPLTGTALEDARRVRREFDAKRS